MCLFVASFETFGSGSFGGPLGGSVGFGGPLGVRWVLVVLWGSGGKIGKNDNDDDKARVSRPQGQASRRA